MMAHLIHKSTNKVLLSELSIAKSFRSRAQGYIGTKNINDQEGTLFPKSNWIHTCFMSIAIDVIYLDGEMKVKKIQKNLKPWRFPAPVFGASSVLETRVGFIDNHQIHVGDTLHVGD
ncbi:MAG: DUF192 domain-containing protein [Pseudomonadota bacterium]